MLRGMHVFHDPTGRRSRRFRQVLTAGAAAVLLLGGAFATGVLLPPPMELLPVAHAAGRRAMAPSAAAARDRAGCADLASASCAPVRRPVARRAAVDDPIVAAFAVQWDPASRAALQRIGQRLDWVIIEGGFLGRGAPGSLELTLDPDLLDAARDQGVAAHVMLTNYAAGRFDPALVRALVSSVAARQQAVRDVADAVERHRLAGVSVDFERLPPESHADVLAFIRELRRAVAPSGAVVSVALPAAADSRYPVAEYARAADFVIPMLYDEHAAATDAGPVAGEPWFVARLDEMSAIVPPAKLLAGVGQYGYHWRSDRPEGVTVSAGEGAALARAAAGGPWFHGRERAPHGAWRDANGVAHTVWYLDAVTAWNHGRASLGAGAAGLVLWRLGTEDPTLWRVLGRQGIDAPASALATLPDDGIAVLDGDGEVLAVESLRGDGHRTLTLTPRGDVVHEAIDRAPGGFRIERAGAATAAATAAAGVSTAAPRLVALTFDDGPDPQWTPAILDTLAAREAVASFFVVGRAVLAHPAVARRIVAEGHEIGNHSLTHPDLGGLGETALQVEIAGAGRVIEAVTGKRPRLFRPPYIGDARPATAERLRPMAAATALGLRTAALEVDTRDWLFDDPATIVRRALDGLARGRIILLHDAGGDRRATLAAVGPLVDSLRARGYTLTTVAGLLDAPAAQGLPAVPADEQPHRVLDGVALVALRAGQGLLVGVFALALGLGVLRLVGLGTLATIERMGRRREAEARPLRLLPAVTVVVPAYNEGRVIGRTIRSLLAQGYPGLRVIVVDDGSRDDTAVQAEVVADEAPEGAVVVLRQNNAGKAAALGTGFAAATTPIIVVVDADTVLAPDALRALVAPMADARVAAVAGNAKVGNRVNLVTRWQALEYITSQNLDRRAFHVLNAITV
ncbi:MAG: glycosyltransferase, partial [Gemmatimonadaceae bacterium]|nr:glycosyltransferase [Gemmatimonadaceae bacterium]